jgi:hypothetical protein
MTRATFVAALVLLAGCASSQSDRWTKSDMTEDELSRDRSECLMQAQQMTPGRSGPSMKLNYARYEECMATRGYSASY